jgi:hypothetical protein
LKKCRNRLCRGPGAGTERAGSIGWAVPWLRALKRVSAGGGGGHLPRSIYTETSLQIAIIKLKNRKLIRLFPENLHFAFCNFHFSMNFSVPFQNAELIRAL